MTAPIALVVSLLAGLLLAEIKRWAPWLAKKIVDRAALRYDEPKRAEEREAAHANLDYCKTPVSRVSYAIYTYVKAPLDWYCIMPAVSGLVGDAPCERADVPRWRRITRLWFLHRAPAACTVAAATTAVPIVASASASSAAETLWSLTAVTVALGGLAMNRGFATAFRTRSARR